jgi:hypothetical protein
MTDRYLKAVLTVIAFALCWIAIELTMRNAKADVVQAGAGSVAISSPLVPIGTRHDTLNGDAKVVAVYCVNCASTR